MPVVLSVMTAGDDSGCDGSCDGNDDCSGDDSGTGSGSNNRVLDCNSVDLIDDKLQLR